MDEKAISLECFGEGYLLVLFTVELLQWFGPFKIIVNCM